MCPINTNLDIHPATYPNNIIHTRALTIIVGSDVTRMPLHEELQCRLDFLLSFLLSFLCPLWPDLRL